MFLFSVIFQQKLQLKKKKKKEREALGDKVSFLVSLLCVVPNDTTHFTLALKYILPLYKVAVSMLGIIFSPLFCP